MNPNFNPHNDHHQPTPAGQPNSSSADTLQRDRFELLSAYLDGEVTAAERKQVEEWLATDPTMQRLHSQMLKLHYGFQNMPIPTQEKSVEQTVEQVLARVERKPRRSLIWGGAAIAALFVGGLATVFSGDRSPIPQFANRPTQQEQTQPKSETASSEPLLIALDKPLVAIPKAPTAEPNRPATNAETPQNPAGTPQ